MLDGVQGEKCAALNDNTVKTSVDLSAVTKIFDEYEIKYIISDIITHYLCDKVYYHVLCKMRRKAVFFHIPPLKYQSEIFYKLLLRIFNNKTNLPKYL